MAGRMIRLGDVAAGMLAAVPSGAGTVRLRLVIPMLARVVPEGAALWATILHARAPSRTGWLARLRRMRRRSAGWAPVAIELHWTRAGIVARTDGRRIAVFPVTQGGLPS
ncbi:hypothetical protein M9979_09820 [Sphingomonas sp. RP10(2022)]|uniref:Uncharacterized protein n=1 Tax=Sphingomonas liriopis TaxID=2949094 RepID=A0A9X2HZU5_9SPHN|nr:hypothetical protein [Sphingomonas liriopis]MCP3735165.1 hypothetical protein [Sphingomonas liriopis]